jgi:hypothetical protein
MGFLWPGFFYKLTIGISITPRSRLIPAGSLSVSPMGFGRCIASGGVCLFGSAGILARGRVFRGVKKAFGREEGYGR